MNNNIHSLMSTVDASDTLRSLQDHLDFAERFINYTGLHKSKSIKINQENLQSLTVAINNNNYYFLQFPQSVNFALTRPIRKELFLDVTEFSKNKPEFLRALKNIREIKEDKALRSLVNSFIYTCQMSISCTLDAFGNPNKARKKNGAYFENLIREVVKTCGVANDHTVEKIKIDDESDDYFSFEYDIVFQRDGERRAIGQIKTSTKDHLDKIFLDKLFYQKCSKQDIPFIAIVLNDVQRTQMKKVSSTFLPGHYRAYSIYLTPLSGVYYVDLASSAKAFKNSIHTLDQLLVEDMWKF